MPYIPGEYRVRCSRCGMHMLRSDVRPDQVKGENNKPTVLVCKSCWDGIHPANRDLKRSTSSPIPGNLMRPQNIQYNTVRAKWGDARLKWGECHQKWNAVKRTLTNEEIKAGWK